MKTRRKAWQRLVAEAGLIVVSVYVAIVLEGMSDDRARRDEATDGLVQLLAELQEDRSDLIDVLDQQEAQSQRYGDLRHWFSTPAVMPLDSVGLTLDLAGYASRTLFPRNSSWTMMISGGMLSFITDRALVTQLADLYGNAFPRLEVTSTRYDDSFLRFHEEIALRVWDFENGELLASDRSSIAIFRNELRSLASWNEYYRDFVAEYGANLDDVISDIEEYLSSRGHRASLG